MDKHNVLNLKEEIDKMVNERLDKEETADDSIPSMISHPRHYNREGAIECIDEMELIYGPEAVMWFCLLNAHKYRYRAGLKNNGYEDLEKSDWYMNKYKQLKEKVEANKIITTQPTNPWTITPTVVPTTIPNWWGDPNYTFTCNINTTVANK